MRTSFIRNALLGTVAALFGGASFGAPMAAEPIHRPAVLSRGPSDVPVKTQQALAALGGSVQHLSSSRALETAFSAYFAYQAAHPDDVKKPYLYFVDFGQSPTAQRGYVFDMNSLTLVDGPFTVAQGSGSGSGVPTRFSNASQSRATSLGLYVTGNTYAFSGHSGGHVYSSIAMRLNGKSRGYNDNALARGVVAHGAPYVTANRAGRSQGCPAMEPARAARLLPKLANGSVVFLFAPDAAWMAHDQWVNAMG
jgi:hypothetical protein